MRRQALLIWIVIMSGMFYQGPVCAAELHVSAIRQPQSDVFLQSLWVSAESVLSQLRSMGAGMVSIGSGVAIESEVLPPEPDVDGFDHLAMLRTTMIYDDSWVVGFSVAQPFGYDTQMRLGSTWVSEWDTNTSFQAFYRLHGGRDRFPLGVSVKTLLDPFQISCSYNSGIGSESKDAFQMSIGFVF